MMSYKFIDKIKSTIQKYSMIKKSDRILVGLSGGIDSIVLLNILCLLRKEYILDIYIGHLDHKLRGNESHLDRKFCEEVAAKLGLDIICEEIDVSEIARRRGISIEEAARFQRYDFLRRAGCEKDIKKIAVAHNRDDQAETVLMRLTRGAGMLGLGGMKPVRSICGVTIIRPLIEISRGEIEKFAEKNALKFRHDSSNDKTIFTRNRLRHELIPYLEKNFNPNIKDVLSNMAENMRVENDFLEHLGRRKFRAVSKKMRTGEIVMDIKKFRRFPEAIKRRVLRAGLEYLKGDLRRFTYRHLKEIDALINNRPVNSKVDLPAGISILKNRDGLLLRRGLIGDLTGEIGSKSKLGGV